MGYMTYFPPWSSRGAHSGLSGSCSAPKLWPSSWVVTRSASCGDDDEQFLCLTHTDSNNSKEAGINQSECPVNSHLGQDGLAIVLGAGEAGIQVDHSLLIQGRRTSCGRRRPQRESLIHLHPPGSLGVEPRDSPLEQRPPAMSALDGAT